MTEAEFVGARRGSGFVVEVNLCVKKCEKLKNVL